MTCSNNETEVPLESRKDEEEEPNGQQMGRAFNTGIMEREREYDVVLKE